jgi:hypothetical protein
MFENNEGVQTPEAYFEALVGEGKKYGTPADLAKAYANADAKIMADAAELAALREAKTELEITKRLLDERNRVVPTVTPTAKPETPVVAPLSDEDLETRIENKLTERNEKEQRKHNQNIAAARLVEVFGDATKAKEAINLKALELGVSSKWLEDTAATSPTAFFSAMGVKPSTEAPTSTPAPKGNVNPEALVNAGHQIQAKPGTFAYYNAIRKSDPKLYRDASTQRAMHNDAVRLGAAFYS